MLKVKADKIRYSPVPGDSAQYKESMNKYYDVMASLYGLFMFLFPPWKRWLASVLPYIQGPRVLEVSFGPGYLMHRYANHYDVWGIDYNQKMVQKTRKRLKGIVSADRIIQGDVEHLPYPDDAFDTIINTFAFTAYPDGKKALQEMLRVLKPGGSLLLLDIDYPANRNLCGYCLIKFSEWAGDIIKDIEGMLKQMRVTYLVKTIGGFGSVSLYVITKEGESLPRQ
jgi:ubiquinone/menaquinone biosynthesis C-methylase UbiE